MIFVAVVTERYLLFIPYILKILKDYGCGVDCASMAELMMGYALDYKPEEIAGSQEVWANGGEVRVLNFENGCSTTNVIKKIQSL